MKLVLNFNLSRRAANKQAIGQRGFKKYRCTLAGNVAERCRVSKFFRLNVSSNKVVTEAPPLVIMAALRSRCGHYIFILWFLLSFFFLFYPRLISAVGDWMSTILAHMVWS